MTLVSFCMSLTISSPSLIKYKKCRKWIKKEDKCEYAYISSLRVVEKEGLSAWKYVVLGESSGEFVNLPAGLRKLPDYRWVTMWLADRQNQHGDGCQENLCQGAHKINRGPAAMGQSLGPWWLDSIHKCVCVYVWGWGGSLTETQSGQMTATVSEYASFTLHRHIQTETRTVLIKSQVATTDLSEPSLIAKKGKNT